MTKEQVIDELAARMRQLSFRQLRGFYAQTGDHVWKFYVNKPEEGLDGWELRQV